MTFLWNRRTLKRVAPPSNKFSDTDLDYSRIFEDDYVHKNHLTLNYAGKGLNFAVKSKATVDLKGASLNKVDPKTSFSTKIITQVADSALEAKFDNKGTVRLWTDLGTYDVGVPLTVTAKVKTNNTFDRLSWAAQLHSRHGDVLTWNRLHVKGTGHLFWNAKAQYVRGDILAGVITKLSTATLLLSKISAFGAYQVNANSTVFAEFNTKTNGIKADPTSQVLTVASTVRARNNNYGVKLAYNLLNKVDPISVEVGTVAKINSETTVRAKIDNKTTLALSTKYVHNSNLTIQVGTAVTLNEPASFTTNKVVPVPLGVRLNFAYL